LTTACGARENVQNTHLDDLKHRIRTESAKLDHAVIAAAVRQWRGRLSPRVRAGGRALVFQALLSVLTLFFNHLYSPVLVANKINILSKLN